MSGVLSPSVCVYMCPCVIFVHLLHIWALTFLLLFQVSLCMWQKEDKRQPKKAWSHKDWTICLMLLFWPCEVCEHISCSEFSYSGVRKYGAETYFSHDGICQVDKPFHCNLRGCCVGCVKHPLHLCLPSLLYILARVASEILLVAILKTLEGDLEKIGTCLVWIFF